MLMEPLSLTAFSLGLLHALEPGHGKTLMAGTLVGSQRKWELVSVMTFRLFSGFSRSLT